MLHQQHFKAPQDSQNRDLEWARKYAPRDSCETGPRAVGESSKLVAPTNWEDTSVETCFPNSPECRFEIWVDVKIMVPFWIPIIVRHLIFRVPEKGP